MYSIWSMLFTSICHGLSVLVFDWLCEMIRLDPIVLNHLYLRSLAESIQRFYSTLTWPKAFQEKLYFNMYMNESFQWNHKKSTFGSWRITIIVIFIPEHDGNTWSHSELLLWPVPLACLRVASKMYLGPTVCCLHRYNNRNPGLDVPGMTPWGRSDDNNQQSNLTSG